MFGAASNAPQMAQTFRLYAGLRGGSLAPLIHEQSRRLAVDLYVETDRRCTPSAAEIAADVKRQGWHIPRRFADGRMGRGTPAAWKSTALGRRTRRGRMSKAERAQREAFLAEPPTLAEMQAFVIKMRSAARKYLASGWAGAARDLGGALKISSGEIQRIRGRAEITLGGDHPRIVLVNDTPGIVTMDAKRHFVRAAIERRIADMREYIRRRLVREFAGAFASETSKAAVSYYAEEVACRAAGQIVMEGFQAA